VGFECGHGRVCGCAGRARPGGIYRPARTVRQPIQQACDGPGGSSGSPGVVCGLGCVRNCTSWRCFSGAVPAVTMVGALARPCTSYDDDHGAVSHRRWRRPAASSLYGHCTQHSTQKQYRQAASLGTVQRERRTGSQQSPAWPAADARKESARCCAPCRPCRHSLPVLSLSSAKKRLR
jgi:hypothetical protein